MYTDGTLSNSYSSKFILRVLQQVSIKWSYCYSKQKHANKISLSRSVKFRCCGVSCLFSRGRKIRFVFSLDLVKIGIFSNSFMGKMILIRILSTRILIEESFIKLHLTLSKNSAFKSYSTLWNFFSNSEIKSVSDFRKFDSQKSKLLCS